MSKGYVVCVYESINDDNALKDYAIKREKQLKNLTENF